MKRFHDVRVLMVGGSSGIGLEAAKIFAQEGARVLLVARTEEKLRSAQTEVHNSTYFCADISNRESCMSMHRHVVNLWGGIDIVVNNAAVHYRGAVNEREPEELAEMIRCNLEAPIYISRLFLPQLLESKGVLINVASLAGCVPLPFSSTYSASKFGLRAFTLALAQELKKQDVHVAVVSPGPVATDFLLDNLDVVSDITLSQPILSAKEVGNAIVKACISRKNEIALPYFSGVLTTIGYVFPSVHRLLQGFLARKGARQRAKLTRNKIQ